jgi:hypothetical protein
MISAQEVVRKVNEGGRQFSYNTFKSYNRRGLIPKKKSAATKNRKLVWLYPERTVEIVEKIIDERNKGANLDYIASFLWLDIVFAQMSDEELNIIKDYLGDYTFNDPNERRRVAGALAAGLEYIQELREMHIPELKLLRLYWDMWRGIRLLVRFHQGKISEAEFKEKFDPKPELDQETKEFAEKIIDLWQKEEATKGDK